MPPSDIKQIRVSTFHEAYRLSCRRPQNTEEAQYSLPFPVAAALVHGRLGPAELNGSALNDSQVLSLADKVELVEEEKFNARFPAERIARVQLQTAAGDWFDSGEVQAGWDVASPPTDAELREKFRWLAAESLAEERITALEGIIWHCANLENVSSLLALLTPAQH